MSMKRLPHIAPASGRPEAAARAWHRGRLVLLIAAAGLLLGGVGCADDDETGEPGECYPFTGCTDAGGIDGGTSGGRCTNTCRFSYDNQCDDGGPGSDFSLCELGTDCSDCGTRY